MTKQETVLLISLLKKQKAEAEEVNAHTKCPGIAQTVDKIQEVIEMVEANLDSNFDGES